MIVLNDEQQMIRDMVREFAVEELAPHAAQVDESGELAAGILPKLAALNLLGLRAAAERGGAGVDGVTYAIALEEVARACASTAVVLLAHNSLGVAVLEEFASEDNRRRWVEPLARGDKLAAFALSETEAGSDMTALATTAEKRGETWVLRGTKSFVVDAVRAEVFLVAAREPGAPGGVLEVFVIEKGAPGLTVGDAADALGWRGAGIATVTLLDVEVAAPARLGNPGGGLAICERALDGVRLGLGAVAVGIAQGAFERALRYARERPQFGKPIVEHQSIQWRLADAAIDIQAARLTLHAACRRADSGEPVRKAAAIAKLLASEAASRVCDHALQIHGGYGYIVEYQIERSYRDAKLCEIAFGTNELMRMLVALELGREADRGLDLLQ